MLVFLTILFLITAVAAAVTIPIYLRRQKTLPSTVETPAQFQTIQYQSIFAPSEEEIRAQQAEDEAGLREMLRQKILAKAETSDFTALIEAKDYGDEFYELVLKELVFRCDAERFAALSSFIDENKLRTNAEFIERFQAFGENFAGKKDLIRLLHFAALSGSAEIFAATVETAIKISRGLKDFTQTDLFQLAESEFWLLPQTEKASGAGFVLKQKLAKLRSEFQEKR
ncbi:MAG TPA: hypothetical protein VF721_21115 [Pyrinomonadaceae bacterium]|jgi:hypothetical protein